MTTSAWFSCSRCGSGHRSVIELLAHMREAHGAAPVTAEDEAGPINALVELEDGRRVVAPRGQLFNEEV